MSYARSPFFVSDWTALFWLGIFKSAFGTTSRYLEESLQGRIFYVVYEHLVSSPEEVLTELLTWSELSPISPDLTQVSGSVKNYAESFGKYVEEPYHLDRPLTYYSLPNRFEVTIQQNFTWYYRLFYPGRS